MPSGRRWSRSWARPPTSVTSPAPWQISGQCSSPQASGSGAPSLVHFYIDSANRLIEERTDAGGTAPNWTFTGTAINRHVIVDSSVVVDNDVELQNALVPGFVGTGMRLISTNFKDAP